MGRKSRLYSSRLAESETEKWNATESIDRSALTGHRLVKMFKCLKCQELAVLILNGACPNVPSLPDAAKHESCQAQLSLKRPSIGLRTSCLPVQQSDSRFSDSQNYDEL